MQIVDPIFGELSFDYGWHRNLKLNFYGKEFEIALIVSGDEDGIFGEGQYEAYKSLLQNWEQLQNNYLLAILDYYVNTRCELGYDDMENDEFPLVEEAVQISEMISMTSITVPFEEVLSGRDIGITFDCSWDNENGLGLRLINEEIYRIGYQDVAF